MDIGSAEFRDRLRQAIDDEINSLQESAQAQDLKSRRNALAPISCLPTETLAAIFSFLSPSRRNKEVCYSEWICIAHICRRWRETALHHPRLWSHINFDKLTPTGVTEIFARAKMAPLHLEADLTNWSMAQFHTFEKHLKAHISHTRHLGIRGYVRIERLVPSAPTLESLSLSNDGRAVMPVHLSTCTTPSLTSLELEGCYISWKLPLLKGLRTLKILGLSEDVRPSLEDWLDALNEMPQLETLILQSATPLPPQSASLTSEPLPTVTLPSLTRFHILGLTEDCLLALSHLVMPSLTWLLVDALSHKWNGEDMEQLTPYVAQNFYRLQGTEPLRRILIGEKEQTAEVLAWTIPDSDVKVCDANLLFRVSDLARSMFGGSDGNFFSGEDTVVFDALLTLLPMNSVSCLTAQNPTRLSKEFWLRHAPKWPLLERASLVPTTVKAFIDMLTEDAPPDGPRLPSLTKLTLVGIILTTSRTYYLRDMLIERVGQGVPLEVLDLRMCIAPERAIQLLKEIVVEVQEPEAARPMRPMKMKEPKCYRANRYVQGPWSRYRYTYEKDYEEEEEFKFNEDENEVDEYYEDDGGII